MLLLVDDFFCWSLYYLFVLQANSVFVAENSGGSSRGVGLKRITPMIKDPNSKAPCIVEDDVIDLSSGKENEVIEVVGDAVEGSFPGKVPKARGKRQFVKDDAEPLKEIQNISSPLQKSLKIIKQEKM